MEVVYLQKLTPWRIAEEAFIYVYRCYVCIFKMCKMPEQYLLGAVTNTSSKAKN